MDQSQIEDQIKDLTGWSYDADQDSIKKKFEFGSFKEAMGFLVRVAFEAEAMQHHPHIGNVYNQVTIRLNTHDAGDKVTEK
ncbi:4a-hydroxytetrahydrobiopterin dehydratase, partial [Paraburkholderia sp. SIMBA_061]